MKILVTMPMPPCASPTGSTTHGLALNIEALHALNAISRLKPEYKLHLVGGAGWLIKRAKFVSRYSDSLDSIGAELDFDAAVDFSGSREVAKTLHRLRIPLRIGDQSSSHSFLFTHSHPLGKNYHGLPMAHGFWRLLTLLDETHWGISLTGRLELADLQLGTEIVSRESITVIAPEFFADRTEFSIRAWSELISEAARASKVRCVLPQNSDFVKASILNALGTTASAVDFYSGDGSDFLSPSHNYERFIGASPDITALMSLHGAHGYMIVPTDDAETFSIAPFATSLRLVSKDRITKLSQLLEPSLLPDIRDRAPISAFVVCCNEEAGIERCLKSLHFCDEILVIDSGSTDRTLEIAKKYATRIIQNRWLGYTLQKQFSLGQCKHDWVINIDADEEVSSELKGEVLQLLAKVKQGVPGIACGYDLSRVVWHLGRWWIRGGWYPEYRTRLMRRSVTSWGGIDPHEKAIVKGPVERLGGYIYHYTFADLADHIGRMNKYATVIAERMYEKGERTILTDLFVRPIGRIVKFFLLRRGFLEGRRGWIVAVIEGFYVFQKYAKLWELEKRNRSGSNAAKDRHTESSRIRAIGE